MKLSPIEQEKARNDAMAQLHQQLLRGCQYGSELTAEQEAFAKVHDLVVVFGYSDDGVNLRGAINDELGAYEGTELRITPLGLLADWETFYDTRFTEDEFEKYFAMKATGIATIKATFSPEDKPSYTWAFTTAIPHLVFTVMEDEQVYGQGLIFALPDVRKAVQP